MTNFVIPFEEAMKRMSDSDPIEARFEARPNTGVTYAYFFTREEIIGAMRNNAVHESGIEAQKIDFGIHLSFISHQYGPGLLFIATKPEARQSEEQIRQRELNAFLSKKKAHNHG